MGKKKNKYFEFKNKTWVSTCKRAKRKNWRYIID